MRTVSRNLRLILPALIALAAATARAQQPAVRLGAAPLYADATGDLGLYLGPGYGAAAELHWRQSRGAVGLRFDFAYRRFAPATRARPWPGAIPLYIQTGAHILTVLGGPEVTLERGRSSVSLAAALGVASRVTSSALDLPTDSARFFRGTTFSGLAPAGEAIAEALWRVASGNTPMWVGVSVGVLTMGDLDLVREENVPFGVISGAYLNPTPTPATFIGARAGVVIGLRD